MVVINPKMKKIDKAITKSLKTISKACGRDHTKVMAVLAFMYLKIALMRVDKEEAVDNIRSACEGIEKAEKEKRVREEWHRVYGND